MKCTATENEFSIQDDDNDDLLAFEATIDGGMDVVITGRRQYVSREFVGVIQQALLNLYNTGTFDRDNPYVVQLREETESHYIRNQEEKTK